MAGTSKETISAWFDRGVKQGATHMLVASDTFNNQSYPVYIEPGDDVRKRYDELNGPNMQRVMEVYKLSLDKIKQLDSFRALNF